jgi:hypothetical protein
MIIRGRDLHVPHYLVDLDTCKYQYECINAKTLTQFTVKLDDLPKVGQMLMLLVGQSTMWKRVIEVKSDEGLLIVEELKLDVVVGMIR